MTSSVDAETLTMLKDVMEDDFDTLITTYVDDVVARIPRLKAALGSQNFEDLRHCAHSLKGSSSNLGALPLADLCMQVETLAKEMCVEGVEPLLTQIETEFHQVKAQLEAF
ncbi:MAG: histidine kinase [Cellvibrionaceae bacterium]|nr:histidine kinase [Cellvibrionaceae bacterium]|tara:strand:- start:1646 stop:1978 length:333 start_codon:yes stop_codon:yes gene_type:complete